MAAVGPTDFGMNTAARKKVWAIEVWRAQRDESFWFSKNLIGANQKDQNAVIQKVTELSETDRGLECVMQLIQPLAGDGTVGTNTLNGNEEPLVNNAITIRYDKLRHGVVSKGEMAEQATVIRFTDQAKTELGLWLADRLDQLMYLTLSGRAYSLNLDGTTRSGSQLPSLSFAADVAAASTNRIFHAGSATSEGTLTANDKMSWATIVSAKAMAARKRIRKIRGGAKGYYMMVVEENQMRDLRLDPTYQTIARTGADQGVKSNPLFTGADIVIEGVALFAHPKVYNTYGLSSGSKWGSGGTVDGAQALLLGAQAGGLALPGGIQSKTKVETDYDDKPGLSIGRKFGMLKPQFPSPYDAGSTEDFGLLSVKTAAAQ
jgi:N4-gp56 family major capsid protein